ncbi:hypothetical protein Tco_1309074, partial [Tanacetum coccineum]
QKIPKSPWESPIPIGDEDVDVNRFPDEDGDRDGDEAEKRGWGWANENYETDPANFLEMKNSRHVLTSLRYTKTKSK